MFYDACKRVADIDVEAIAAKCGRSVGGRLLFGRAGHWYMDIIGY